MNRIEQLFSEKKENILNVYFTAGYPKLDDTPKVARALSSLGVDLIELGMPYSDPMADGPTIQQSSQVALKNGMNLRLLFKQVQEIRANTQIPMVLMGYYNQMMQFGVEHFLDRCMEVGIDGLIIPDLPLDVFENKWKTEFDKRKLSMSFLMTPETSNERIKKIDQLSNGFVYVVSQSSITGNAQSISKKQLEYFEKVKSLEFKNAKLIGFGIHDKVSFDQACRFAHGAIIGSAFIKALSKTSSLENNIKDFITSIR